MKTKAGKHRYFNAMYNYGGEWARTCGPQYETKAEAVANVRAALAEPDRVKRPHHAWVEGFEKDVHGNVERIY